MRRLAALLLVMVAAACECAGPGLTALVPAVEALPSPLDFGVAYVGYEESSVVRLLSSGGAPLAIEHVSVRGEDFRLATPSASVVLQPGQAQEVVIVIAAQATGALAGALEIVSDARDAPVLTVPLIAAGQIAPPCEDLGPCMPGSFDSLTGACGFDVLEGACDDGSSCTSGDICVTGRCVGEAIDCGEPPAACMVGLCGGDSGCTFLPVDEACDDEDPCTVDVCGAAGCSYTVAADGTSCGAASCAALPVCIAGECKELTTTDGFPCSDGDLCTNGDVCAFGECAGAALTSEGDLLGAAFTFGALGAVGTVLNDGRVVVFDPHEHGRGTLITLLERTSDSVIVQGQSFDASLSRRSHAFAAVGGAGLAVLYDDGALALHEAGDTALALRGGIDLWQEDPAYLAPSLVAVDEQRLAACHSRTSALYILGAADLEAPALLATVPLPAACEHLASDTKLGGTLYATLEDGSVMRITLSSPVHVEEVLTLGARFVTASDGRFAVGRVADEGFGVHSVELYDADTLARLSTISPPLGGGVFPTIEALSLSERWLFVLTSGALYAVDISVPDSPVTHVVSDDDGGVHNASGPRVFSSDGATLVRSFSRGFGDRFHLLDVTGDLPRELVHARRGGVRTFARDGGGRLYALHQSAIRLLDTSDPTAPAMTSGTQRGERRNSLWGLGSGGGLPLFPHSYYDGGTVSGSQPLLWLDGQDPAAVVVVGEANTPFAPGVLSVTSDGRYAHALRITYQDEASFDVYDLAGLVPDAATGPSIPLASLPLALDGAEVNNFKRVTLSGSRVVAVMQHDWNGVEPAADLRSELLLVDVADVFSPVVLASASLTGLVRQGRANDDVILAVQRTSGGWYNTEHEGEAVLRFVLTDGRLELDASLALPESGPVLWLDEHRAVVSTKDGVAFLTHGPGSLVLDGALPLPLVPSSATFVGEALWLAGEHGVVSVQLPCP